MSDNPLEMTPEREHRIRERAYQLWQADGEPHGRDVEYWERARELVGMEQPAAQLPNPAAADAAPRPVVEEAFIQENLGEFPGSLTDQGERQETPTKPRKAPARRRKGATGGA